MNLEQQLSLALLEEYPGEGAGILEGIPIEEAVRLLDELPASVASSVLLWSTPSFAANVLESEPRPRAAELVTALPLDVAAGLLRRLREEDREAVLAALTPGDRDALRRVVHYPEHQAGAHADPRVLTLPRDVTAGEALERVHRTPRETPDHLFVLDRADQLLGVLDLRELLAADPEAEVERLMRSPVVHVRADASTRTVVSHPAWKDFHCLPVVDERGVFQGVMRYRTYRRLEAGLRAPGGDADARTVEALGELLRSGIGGMLDALGATRR